MADHTRYTIGQALQDDPIAIVGMGGIFPKAENLLQFWKNILNRTKCVETVPDALKYWELEDFYDPHYQTKDKTWATTAGFMPEIDFDPIKYGITPLSLETISNFQTYALVVAEQTLKDAGIWDTDLSQIQRDRTGVILAATGSGSAGIQTLKRLEAPRWTSALKNMGIPDEAVTTIVNRLKDLYLEWRETTFPGCMPNIVAGRIANRFDLRGPNFTVDAACASSLTAIDVSVRNLIMGDCDIVLTGGVNLENSIVSFIAFKEVMALSQKNECNPFDASADGLVLGDACSMLVLKRLSDAKRDNDRIYALIRGIGSASDGKAKSLYAPRFEGQVKAIQKAYHNTAISPSDVAFVEAHGTGTPVGDPIEIQSLNEIYKTEPLQKQITAINSIKAQIGHTRIAAGAVSVSKMALALHHKVITPMIGVETPHPRLKLDETPFYLNTTLRPWVQTKTESRKGAVSAFGFGGTNFHVVMEEYVNNAPITDTFMGLPNLVFFYATDKTTLLKTLQNTHQQLIEKDYEAVHTTLKEHIQTVPPKNNARIAFHITDIDDLQKQLNHIIQTLPQQSDTTWQDPSGIFYRDTTIDDNPEIVALFPGQGSQYLNMACDLICGDPSLIDLLGKFDIERTHQNLSPLSDILYPKAAFNDVDKTTQKDALTQTINAQPALGFVCLALWRTFKKHGLSIAHALGQSFGELTALHATGVISETDFIRLSVTRGKIMGQLKTKEKTGMLAVSASEEEVTKQIKESQIENLYITNQNAPEQTVIGGKQEAINTFKTYLANQKIAAQILTVSAAFHTPYVAQAATDFHQELKPVAFQSSQIPVYANAKGTSYSKKKTQYAKWLSDQINHPVKFVDCVQAIPQTNKPRIFVELGPKTVLTGLVKQISSPESPDVHIATDTKQGLPLPTQVVNVLAHLKVLGVPLDLLDCLPKFPKLEPKPAIQFKISGGIYYKPETDKRIRQLLFEKDPNPIWPNQQEKIQDIQTNQEVSAVAQHAPPQNTTHTTAFDALTQTHQQFLEIQAKLVQQFSEKMAQHQKLINDNATATEINAIAQQLTLLGQQQDNLNRVQQQFMQQQMSLLNGHTSQPVLPPITETPIHTPPPVFESVSETPIQEDIPSSSNPFPIGNAIVPEETSPLPEPAQTHIPTPAETPTISTPKSPLPNIDMLQKQLLTIIEEKTGYPASMINLDMDLESELGIDSIKRLEIFAAASEMLPDIDLESLDEEMFVGVNTLGKVIDVLQELMGENSPDTPAANGLSPATSSLPNIDMLQEQLLTIIEEKTGYPASMINLDMDLESELGIDSIKRLEIFAAASEMLPDIDLESLDEEMFVGVNTLGKVIGVLQELMGASPPETTMPLTENNGTSTTQTPPSETDEINADIFQQKLFEMLTGLGLPPEAIDMDMDLESELGIDSIRKLEMLSLVNEHLPDVDIDYEGLQEIRTPNDMLNFVRTTWGDTTTDTSEPTKIEPTTEVAKYKITTRNMPPLEPQALQTQYTWLIVDNASNAATQLLDKMQQENLSVCHIKLNPSNTLNTNDIPTTHVSLETDEETFETQVSEFLETHGPIGGCIWFSDAPTTENDLTASFDSAHFKHTEKLFLLAKLLAPTLTTLSELERTHFITVSQSDNLGNFMSRGSVAFTQSLQAEWPAVFCRHIDIDSTCSIEQNASIILEECQDTNTETVVVKRSPDGKRFVPDLEIATPSEFDASSFDTDDVILVTGGARGITAACTVELAQRVPCHYVLLGRTQIEPEPAWAQGIEQEPALKEKIIAHLNGEEKTFKPKDVQDLFQKIMANREIQTTIDQISQTGATCDYLSVDVQSQEQVQQAIDETVKKSGAITGVVYAAGVIRDQVIEQKTLAQFQTVLQTKLQGLGNVLQAIDMTQVKRILLFSSVSGVFGNRGQTDYAWANRAFNEAARALNNTYPHITTSAIAWGPWEGGMMQPALQEIYRRHNIGLISLKEGAGFFASEFSNLKNVDATCLFFAPFDPAVLSKRSVQSNKGNA